MHARMPVGSRPVRIVAIAAAVALSAAPAAHAGPIVSSATNCSTPDVETPFLRWGDVASYVLAPNGVAEDRSGWTLADGADVTPGNEPFYVHAPGDRSALSLPSGSSATTAPMCVGIEHPTLRLVARNTGSLRSALIVEVLFEDADGNVHSLSIGAVAGGSRWQPSAPLPVIANLLPLLPDARTAVAFRFRPIGAGDWDIDDVYVDPWRHG